MLRIIILVLALTAGGVTAWLAMNMRPEPTVKTVIQPAPPAPMQEVLVASVNLGEGQVLTRDNMRWQAWPESSLNGAFTRGNCGRRAGQARRRRDPQQHGGRRTDPRREACDRNGWLSRCDPAVRQAP
jgi:Flp pilus assembly protein CpaB